jgi:hypothetical protein
MQIDAPETIRVKPVAPKRPRDGTEVAVRSESDCGSMRQAASIRLDGELSHLGSRRLTRHLAFCVPCAEFAATLRVMVEAVRRAEATASPPGGDKAPVFETGIDPTEPDNFDFPSTAIDHRRLCQTQTRR